MALVAFIAFLVNFPLLHSTYVRWQVERSGVDVVAEVTETRNVGGDLLVEFTVPGDGRREPFDNAVAEVDAATYDEARRTGRLDVRVLRDDGGSFIVEGQVTSRLGLVVTVLADVFLVAMVVLMLRVRSALRVELVLRATEDLERCPPGPRLDRLSGLRYVVSGEVAELGDDEVVLDLGDRRVRVLLDGHANPAGYQQPVRAVGHMVA
ncbi:MAG TPA: hypothetical protein VFI44_12965 [Ornithinibacter sp.]|nr:hypothetical protein [Ornithinibacter sp.]